MAFTIPQQNAIDARNPAVLISAAAGSGKTTVLIKRILSLIQEGYSLDRMLIVTFTRAAASEMRTRLQEAMEKDSDPAIRKQILNLNRAFICTIDVFCKRVITEHFQAAGIDAMPNIGQKGRLDQMLQLTLENVLEAAYSDPDPDETCLFDNYTNDQVTTAVNDVRTFMLTLDDPDGWARAACAPDIDHNILPKLISKCRLLLDGAFDHLDCMDHLLNLPDGPSVYQINYDQDRETLLRLKHDLESNMLIKDGYTFDALNRKKKGFEGNHEDLKAEFKDHREKIKDIIKEIMADYPFDRDAIQNDLDFILPSIRAVIHLAQRVQLLYDHAKRDKNLLDFSDLSRLCVKVLRNDTIREQVASQFDAVFVDECQDISLIQDFIINATLNKKTLFFMVGDVKQSIYRFRQANPKLFQDKYAAFKDEADAKERRIILQHNFRSDKNLLNCINHIFRYCMRASVTELDYNDAAMLYPPETAQEGPAVDLVLLRNDTEASKDSSDSVSSESIPEPDQEAKTTTEELAFGYKYEAAYMAKRIQEIVGQMDIHDKNGTRKARYRDIVILLRKSSDRAPFIAKLLSSAGIPVFSDADSQYYDLPEIRDVLSVLHILDNPLQDMPLLAALHCPCFDFSYQELAAIRLRNKSKDVPFHQLFFDYDKEDALGEKIRATIARLDEWRFLASQLPLNAFLWRLILESGLYIRAGAQTNGELRQGNLRLLCEQAGQIEQAHDLHGFLQLARTSSSSKDTPSARTISESDDVVRIMTMHKSKGLEFPVVFIGELCLGFRPDNTTLLTDSELGCCIRYIDGENRLTKETAIQKAFCFKKKEEKLADECRLLYVAMTRAKNKLILIGSPRNLDNLIKKASAPMSDYSIYAASSMLDWLCPPIKDGLLPDEDTLYTDEQGGQWQILHQNCSELNVSCTETIFDDTEQDLFVPEDIIWYMTRENTQGAVLKISVSSLAKKHPTDDDMEETPETKRHIEIKRVKPHFMEEVRAFTGAEKGTITHKILGCIDYDLVRAGKIDRALDKLVEKGLITAREMDSVQKSYIFNFFSSDLGARVLASPRVQREWPFNLQLSNGTLLQGVIDLCFMERGEWVLVDYKTDRMLTDALAERYGGQINWYRTALENITNFSVREMVLFSLPLGRPVTVNKIETEL